MRACIYARTSVKDKSHRRTSLENQVSNCRQLALRHNLMIDPEHVFTDQNLDGTLPPTCWAPDDTQPGRPAISAMIEAIMAGKIQHVIVDRVDRLGTSSDTLERLLELLDYHNADVVVSPEQLAAAENPSEKFAAAVMMPRITVDTEAEHERKAQIRAKKSEEIVRLQAKIARLEADIAEL